MPEYPRGTVAFLFTDIEGSTRRWESDQQAMGLAVERHFALLRETITAQDGVVFKTIGDAVQAAFPTVPNAIAAALNAQIALKREDWGDLGPLRVRMAIHAGEATPRDGDYVAPTLNRLSRVLGTGYGEQILLTHTARTLATTLPVRYALQDLGQHRLRDLLQPEHIYQLRGPELDVDFPPLKSLDRHLHNLPAQPTTLLGREAEVAAARALLQQDGVRMVTLTGPGGTGKTRLGLQVGAELVDVFADGVWFVPLAAIADPALVVPAIAQSLGLSEVASQPLLNIVQDYLKDKQALLLLDNFEHLTSAASTISALLAACPTLKVLITSREPLRITGEREIPVPPLSLPSSRQVRGLSPAAFLEYPAIRLFVERAQTVKPDFALTEAIAADVAAICLRLDGLPLAIELAAARVRVLPPGQLLARLDRRLKILTGGNRDLPARQQTLRAAIEWSHELLDPDEQSLFAHLAVFAGGCTLEAAEAVCGAHGGHEIDVLDGLDSLSQKSLLRPEEGSEGWTRFTMLETIREYALERLDASGEADSLRQAHARFFLDLAEAAEPQLTGPDQVLWLDRLGTEHDNLRAALGWLERSSEREPWLRLSGALWRFWWVRGHMTEGRGWLARALAETDGLPPAVRAKSLSGAGILAESQGDYVQAKAFHEESLALARQSGDRFAIAASLTDLGIIAAVEGDYARATDLHSQALALWRELDDEPGMAGSLFELGSLARNRGDYMTAADLLGQSLALARKSGDASTVGAVLESLAILAFNEEDFDRASQLFEESLALWRQLGDSGMIAQTLVNLGEVLHHQGDLRRAEAQYQEALSLFQELGDKRGTAFASRQLGRVALARNEVARATALFTESLALSEHAGDKSAIIESIDCLAEVACARGEHAVGVRLYGSTGAIRLMLGTPLPGLYQAQRDQILAAARNALGEFTFTREWDHGRALSLPLAIAEARELNQTWAKASDDATRVAALA